VPLRFLLDEHLRGPLWRAIQRHNVRGGQPIDAARVGDPADLPLSSDDADILIWAEREGRILLTLDEETMPAHLARHLQAGRHSPGVIVLDSSSGMRDILDALELIAHAGDPADFQDQVRYVP
jgi:hypothetical protein